jgi:carbon-monoxide dehydrogenase medium subunit
LAKAEGAKLLAGGQSLGPMLNLRLARPSLLVDVSRLESLARVDDIGSTFRIGACVTHSRIEDMRGRLAGGEMLCEVARALPIGRSATAARSAVVLPMPTLRRTGCWRWPRLVQ